MTKPASGGFGEEFSKKRGVPTKRSSYKEEFLQK